MTNHVKRTSAAIETHYQFPHWLVPAVDRFPKSQKFVFWDRILKLALDGAWGESTALIASFTAWRGRTP